jgi:hypothetical protein
MKVISDYRSAIGVHSRRLKSPNERNRDSVETLEKRYRIKNRYGLEKRSVIVHESSVK